MTTRRRAVHKKATNSVTTKLATRMSSQVLLTAGDLRQKRLRRLPTIDRVFECARARCLPLVLLMDPGL